MSTTDRTDSENRARLVANIRALADFVETRTDLPVPQRCTAQYSVLESDYPTAAQRIAVVADAGRRLGVQPSETHSVEWLFGDKYAHFGAAYIVHNGREPDEPLPDDEVDSDAEAPQPAPTELSTALPHRLPETWPAPGAAPPLDPDSPPYASAIAYRAEPRWTW